MPEVEEKPTPQPLSFEVLESRNKELAKKIDELTLVVEDMKKVIKSSLTSNDSSDNNSNEKTVSKEEFEKRLEEVLK